VKIKELARFALLLALALILGWVESLLPIAPGLPGIKLGLANTVLLYAVCLCGARQSFLLMLGKAVLSGFLFAGLSGLLYSLAGGVLSLVAMLMAKRIPGIGVPGVSVCGALLHNVGQTLVACVLVQPRAALTYLPILLFSAIITGVSIGVAAQSVFRALHAEPISFTKHK
jgi:heptaprenyl diphosphate synthase